MLPVTFHIVNVIKAIDAAGDETEGKERPQCLHKILLVQQVVAEEQWGGYKGILKPLQGAQKHQSILHWVQRYENFE